MQYLLLILAVVVGFVIGKSISTDQKFLTRIMAFSGAFLLSLTILEILPEVYEVETSIPVGIYILFGVLLQLVLELFSKGAEHGHFHYDHPQKSFPWLLFIGLSIHALLEGLPIAEDNHLLWGILIHKIPEATMLTLFFTHGQQTMKNTMICLSIFALMTPIGVYLAANNQWIIGYQTEIYAVVVGVFLHLSTTLLFESNKNHNFNISKVLFILLGVLLAYVV